MGLGLEMVYLAESRAYMVDRSGIHQGILEKGWHAGKEVLHAHMECEGGGGGGT